MAAGGAARSSAQSQDAAGRNTTEFVGALVVGGERVTIRGGRAALNSPLIVAGIHGRIPPRPVVGHRAFDAKEPLIVVGDDEEERRGLLSHDRPRAFFQAAAKPGATS